MTTYVALLRGVGPGNPNMHQKRLISVLEDLQFSSARAVISSGNVIFESDIKDTAMLETMLEKAWPQKLGFTSATIVRSQQQLERLVSRDLFKGIRDEPASRLRYHKTDYS